MKQWAKFDRFDLSIFLLNSPAIIFFNYLLFGSAYFQDGSLFFWATLLLTIWGGGVIFVVLTLWMKYMRYRFGEPDQFGQRLLYSMLMYVAVMIVSTTGIFYVVYGLLGYPYKPETLLWLYCIGFVTNVISAGCHESIFTYNQLRQSTQREFMLKQLHMQQQMDVLKQQVNPHFLFNSLNSLIALIDENPRQAGTFAEELSSVYRYVLRVNEHNLTDLATELEFIHSYAHLLRTRYGPGFQLITKVDEQFSQYQLPPLTLQLLVENAVKHNVVTNAKPLTVEIQTDDLANLHVRNNIQRKKHGVVSNGVGLTNILAKYEILGQAEPSVREETDQFVVALPLIPNAVAALA